MLRGEEFYSWRGGTKSLAMHRALNIKHRIVRRVDIGKAPLATFDTIDLGDEDANTSCGQSTHCSGDSAAIQQVLNFNATKVFCSDGSLKSETIGGNNSKKSLSLAGGEDKGGKDAEVARDKSKGGGEEESTRDRNENSFAPTDSTLVEAGKCVVNPPETNQLKQDFTPAVRSGETEEDHQKTSTVQPLSRQGTIGRVSIPIKKQDSDSSSSSGSCHENTPTFHVARPSVGHLDSSDLDGNLCDLGSERDCQSNLVPDNIDPSQILSPSKRKAYERRIERLRVTTSPIARPRSHTPISVVTLDEYATISSPEASPAPPSAIPDKLKITLPCDEFTLKPKTPKLQSARRKDSDETCFEFAEDILFSRTKSALVVNEDGQIPVSPRRVLIPPTITPTTSPKLSAAPRLSASSPYEEYSNAPKLLYIQQNETPHSFFGETVDEAEEENWASFPDSSASVCRSESPCADNKIDESDPLICDSNTTLDQDGTELTDEQLQSQSHVAENLELGPVTGSKTTQDLTDKPRGSDHLCANVYNVETEENSHSTGLVILESDEILTVEINLLEKGCEKHIEIDIKPSGSLSPADVESLGVSGKPLTLGVSKADLSSHSKTTHVNNQTSPLTLGPQDIKDSGSSHEEENDLALYDETTDLYIEEPLPDTSKCHPLSHTTDSQPLTSISSSLAQSLPTGPQHKGQEVVYGHLSFNNKSDSLATRIVPVSKVLQEEVPPLLPERPLSIHLFEKLIPPLPQRPPISNLCEDKFQSTQRVPPPVPERPPSTNLFEDNLQVLEKIPPPVPERPPSTNICEETLKPFEQVPPPVPERPPSTNTCEETLKPFEQVPPPVPKPSTNICEEAPQSCDPVLLVLQQTAPSTNPSEGKFQVQDRNPPPLPKRPASGHLFEERSATNIPPPIPQRSPSSNPLETRLESSDRVPPPLPPRPPSTNPFESGFGDQVLDPFGLGLQPPNISAGTTGQAAGLSDLFLLLDSQDSSSA